MRVVKGYINMIILLTYLKSIDNYLCILFFFFTPFAFAQLAFC